MTCQTDGSAFSENEVPLYATMHKVIGRTNGDDPFGRVQSGQLQIDTSLFPCKVRRYCNHIGVHKSLGLHYARQYNDKSIAAGNVPCKTEELGLDTQGAELRLSLDYNPCDDLSFEKLPSCSTACGLIPVFVFRLQQVESKKKCTDYFTILSKHPQRTSTYYRIGILSLSGHTQNERDR